MFQEDIEKNKVDGCEVIVVGDFNAKVGRNDEEEIKSPAGKILEKMAKECSLYLMNHHLDTKGRWTRVEGEHKSEIDYVLTTHPLIVSNLVIDEEKFYSAYRIKKTKNETKAVYPDHNALMGEISWKDLMKSEQGKRYRYIMTKSSFKEFNNKIQEERPDLQIDESNDVESEYDKFTRKILDMYKGCEKKVKINKIWKVDRILIQQIKDVKKQLRKRENEKFYIEVLKIRLQLLQEHIIENVKIKNTKEVEYVVSNISATGKSDLSFFD